MTVTLRGRGSDGRVAIYTGNDDAPFDNPLGHLSRLKFHSSLDYPKIVYRRTVNVTFPSRTSTARVGTWTQSFNLFAHGRPGQPWVLASARIAGVDVAFCGSVPVQHVTQWARWVSVGSDGSHVRAFEYTVMPTIEIYKLPAITIPITVWVTDEAL